MGDRLIDVLAPDQLKVPAWKKRDVKRTADHAKMVVARLRALQRAKTGQEWRDLREALRFDFRELELDMQTI